MFPGVSALGRLYGALLGQRASHKHRAAWASAVAGPPLIAVAAEPIRTSLGLAGYALCVLLVVAIVALTAGWRPALAAVATGFVSGWFVFATPANTFRLYVRLENAPLGVFLVVGVALALLVDRLAMLLEQQTALRQREAALRRVATLVARAAPPREVFAAATQEVGQVLGVDLVGMSRYEPDGTVTILSSWRRDGGQLPLGSRWALEPGNLSTTVARTGQPARMDKPTGPRGSMGAIIRDAGVRSAVAAPIRMEARLWGVMIAGSNLEQPLPAGSEERLADFTNLVGTAIANAEARDELAASRARVVAAGDEARRRIERDLHDGAQQRLVSLGLELRAAQGSVPPELTDLDGELRRLAEGLASVQDELREIARGIHPAIIAEGGIAPALKALARRSAVPVELDLHAEARLPVPVEVATYYIVSEALTNVAKHAHASVAHVEVQALDGSIQVSVSDDGAGGADPNGGSGLIGLKDRVEALGGSIAVESPPGAGTCLKVHIPITT